MLEASRPEGGEPMMNDSSNDDGAPDFILDSTRK